MYTYTFTYICARTYTHTPRHRRAQLFGVGSKSY